MSSLGFDSDEILETNVPERISVSPAPVDVVDEVVPKEHQLDTSRIHERAESRSEDFT